MRFDMVYGNDLFDIFRRADENNSLRFFNVAQKDIFVKIIAEIISVTADEVAFDFY
jgi:hypothetical protein